MRDSQSGRSTVLVLAAFLVTWGAAGTTTRVVAADDPIEDIVEVLRDKGLIDEATEQQILAKSHRRQATSAAPAVGDGFEFVKGLEWFGDLRLRNEQFWYDSSFGGEADDRNRFRYRARIGFKKQVTENIRVGMRLATGNDFNSQNESFGGNNDFANDTILVDQAWAEFTLPDCDCGWNTSTVLTAGKFSNPFIWKNGVDKILWDGDITPEGAYLRTTARPSDGLELWSTLGYFVIDENSSQSDPKVFAGQLGAIGQLSDGVEAGARISGYEWRSLGDEAVLNNFIDRSIQGVSPTSGGNTTGAFDGKARVGEIFAFMRFASENWPLLVYGTYVTNFTADSVGGFGKENDAYGAGFEIGSAKKLVKLSAGYFRVEANATPARFTDSDLFDGFTNREGFALGLQRQLAERVKLKFTFFDGEEIRTRELPLNIGNVAFNGRRADRKRLQSDIELAF